MTTTEWQDYESWMYSETRECPVCDTEVYVVDRERHMSNHGYLELVKAYVTLTVLGVKERLWK